MRPVFERMVGSSNMLYMSKRILRNGHGQAGWAEATKRGKSKDLIST